MRLQNEEEDADTNSNNSVELGNAAAAASAANKLKTVRMDLLLINGQLNDINFSLENSSSFYLAFTRRSHGDFFTRCPALRTDSFNRRHDVHAFDNFTENDVLPVQPLRLSRAQEKL